MVKGMSSQDRKDLLLQGFTPDQIYEIEEGIAAGLDIVAFERKEFLAIQMRQIRLGLLEKLPVEFYADPCYDWFQMEEIRLGLKDNSY